MTLANTHSTDIFRVLQTFMSETAARLVLKGTLESLQLRAEALSAQDLPRIIEALGPASRHFVDGAARARLQEQLRRMTTTGGVPAPQALAIRTEADAAHARLVARTFCEDLGGSSFQAQKVATSVSELARNQLMYAGGGNLSLHAERSPRAKVKVLAQDSGKGIPAAQLQLILSGGYRSKTGMGLGLLGVKRLSDRFDVQSGPSGTRVELEVAL